MILSMFFSLLMGTAQAQTALERYAELQETQKTPYQICVELCQFHALPGWEMRRCNDECVRRHMPKALFSVEVEPMECPEERQTAAEGGVCI